MTLQEVRHFNHEVLTWNKHPELVLDASQTVLQGADPNDIQREKLYRGLWFGFRNLRCHTAIGDSFNECSDPITNRVAIHPVFLPPFTVEVEQAIRSGDPQHMKHVLKEHLPELERPLIGVNKNRLGLRKQDQTDYVNAFFLDDKSVAAIKSLIEMGDQGSEAITILTRFLMAKFGSFKNMIVLGDEVVLGTLEGGHPVLTFDEAARRLVALGSAKPVEVSGLPETGRSISKEKWEVNNSVRGIQTLGEYLGKKELLSEPVVLSDLVNDPVLARILKLFTSWAQQAEGAFYAYDPEQGHTVTVTGQFGAVKSNLEYNDIVAFDLAGDRLQMVQVGDVKPKSPSVEAREFAKPNERLMDEYEVTVDGRKMPPVRSIIHLHRDFVPSSINSSNIIIVPNDFDKYPPVGCGVDMMEAMSEYAMTNAVKKWIEGGRKAKIAVFYVPNHGINVFSFWSPDESGKIPADPYFHFKRSLDNGDIRLTQHVHQV